MTKSKELKSAKNIIKEFCNLNNLKTPICCIDNSLEEYGAFYINHKRKIFLNFKKCKHSSKRITHSSINEKTITGVYVHEYAHLLHYNGFYGTLNKHFKKLKEPLIHFRETDIEEDIAESIRLFILNPSLLQEGRPKRYKILSKYFKHSLMPHYTEQFKDIPNNSITLINKWINGEI